MKIMSNYKSYLECDADPSDHLKNNTLLYNSMMANLDTDTDFPEIITDGMDCDQVHAQVMFNTFLVYGFDCVPILLIY